MLRYLPLILKNCWRNRRRTILTILSVGVSMCLLGVMIAMYHALYLSDPTPEQALRLVTRNKISLTVPLPLAYRPRHPAYPRRSRGDDSNWFGGTYKDARDPKNFFARFAVEPEKLFHGLSANTASLTTRSAAFVHDRTGCVVGRDLANKFHFKVGDHIHLVGDIYPGDYEFTIRGIFDSPRQQRNHVLQPRIPGAVARRSAAAARWERS